MKPEFSTRKTIFSMRNFWKYIVSIVATSAIAAIPIFLKLNPLFLLLWCVPVIIAICFFLVAWDILFYERIEFHKDEIVWSDGFFNIKSNHKKGEKVFDIREHRFTFLGVTQVRVERTFWGLLFNYGDIRVECVGNWTHSFTEVKRPKKLVKYLKTKMVKPEHVRKFTRVVD